MNIDVGIKSSYNKVGVRDSNSFNNVNVFITQVQNCQFFYLFKSIKSANILKLY